MRKVVELSIKGQKVIGTMHYNPETEMLNTAMIMFNFGEVPRSGHGNIAAKIGDDLCCRMLVFRIDLPGLGDSEGSVPRLLNDLYRKIELDYYKEITIKITENIMNNYNLLKVFYCGLCGGAITSIFVASELLENVKGIILMEPFFLLVGEDEKNVKRVVPKCKSLSEFNENNIVNKIGKISIRILLVRLYRLRNRTWMPKGYNRKLIQSWERTLRKDIPSLLLTARNSNLDGHVYVIINSIIMHRLKKKYFITVIKIQIIILLLVGK